MGRRNYLFSKNDKGAVDYTIFYTLLESCDIVGVNPLEWLTHVLNILHNLQGAVVAGDVVEFNPQRDTVDGMTAMVAAKLVRELAAKISK